MAELRRFAALRPAKEDAPLVACLPYDVMNRAEAKEMAEGNPRSFLHVVRSEIDLPDTVGPYEEAVYRKAKENLERFEEEGILVRDKRPGLYVYAQTRQGRTQRGIVGCASIDEYLAGAIKKHEFTREVKEIDRIRHFDACDAHTEPIFLAYRSNARIKSLIGRVCQSEPTADFVSEDGNAHTCWLVPEAEEEELIRLFGEMESVYIADGHHRTASAAKVGQLRRERQPGYTGEEEFNYFLSVFFDEDELEILDYNRVVKDLGGLGEEEFLDKVREAFSVEKREAAVRPAQPGTFGMVLSGQWYELTLNEEHRQGKDGIAALDVSLLQDHLLQPILGIEDPRTSERIDFVGGIRGLEELERRAQSDMKIAFSLYPTTMTQLLDVADSGSTMPPKSTWFEPKLRSGLFVHPF